MAQPEQGKPFIRNYNYKEYNAHPQNWAVTQDQRGVMYFGHTNGISEYDGVRWRLIQLSGFSAAYALASDTSGNIFVGGQREFGYLSPDASGKLHYVSLTQQFAGKIPDFMAVIKIFTTPDGIYFYTGNFLLRWQKNNTIRIWKPQNGEHFQVFYCNNRLYIKESGSELRYLKEDMPVPLQGVGIVSDKRISAIFPYNDSEIMIATYNSGLFIYNSSTKNTRKHFTSSDRFLAKNQISHGCLLSNGHIALGMESGGIAILNNTANSMEVINEKSGLQYVRSNFLYQDRQGLLWAAFNGGISSIDVQSPVRYWDELSGMKDAVHAVLRYNDTLYLGTEIGVYFFNDGKLYPKKDIPQSTTDLIHFKGDTDTTGGQLLAATNEGIYRLGKNRSERISTVRAYKLTNFFEGSSTLLLAAYDGFYTLSYQDNKWVENKIKSLDNNTIMGACVDEKKNIWLSSYDGIKKLVLGEDNTSYEVTSYNASKGLPDDNRQVVTFFKNNIWVLTPSKMYRYDEASDHFLQDSTFGKIYMNKSNMVYNIVEDFNDNIWIATFDADLIHKGFVEMSPAQENGQYRFSGIPFKRIPIMIFFDIYPEKDGMVWIGGTEGLYRFDTKVKKNYDADFNTLIREVTIANDSVVFYGTNYVVTEDKMSPFQRSVSLQQSEALQPVLKYAENSISFDFAAPAFEDETANRFSYYLEGYDKQWSSWSEKAEKEYTNLPHGDYTFKVKTKNIYDVEGSVASYSFSILPPWYGTYWAYALYLIAFLMLMYSGIKVFNRRLQVQNVRLEKEKAQQQEFSSRLIASQENERKRIAAELHDGINQSLVLIKNKLYIMLNPKMDRNAIEERIKTLTEDVGQTMDEVRGVSYGLRPFQLDQLGLSKSLEALAEDASEVTGIVFETEIDDIDGLFPQDQEINIYRVVQECINNIIKHSGASEATLHVKRRKREAQMFIKDNGRGFDAGKRNTKAKSGFGMMGIRERIRFSGGSLDIASDPGEGSTFTIILPIKNA